MIGAGNSRYSVADSSLVYPKRRDSRMSTAVQCARDDSVVSASNRSVSLDNCDIRRASVNMSRQFSLSVGNVNLLSAERPTSKEKSQLSPRKSPHKRTADRFIPSRNQLNGSQITASKQVSNAHLAEALGVRTVGSRVLEYAPTAPSAILPPDIRSQFLGSSTTSSYLFTGDLGGKRKERKVSRVPETILDAPGIVDDYYLSHIDWSSTNNVAVALANCVYVWNSQTSTVAQVVELPDRDYVASVKWSEEGYLGVGSSTGDIQIWDVEHASKLRTMRGRSSRVSSLAWSDAILSSGSRDGCIWNHDVRLAEHKTAELWGHTGEVCGLAWRQDGRQLASGGNDNLVNIWDARVTTVPRHQKTHHTAAVKALAWCPWQMNVLATGGGSLDRKIHIWNSITGSCTNTIDAGSQVSALAWNSHHRELAACYGYPGNSISIWSMPSLNKVADIEGAHETRILHAALSPDGQTLATCAADENLKFWKLFDAPPQTPKHHFSASGLSLR